MMPVLLNCVMHIHHLVCDSEHSIRWSGLIVRQWMRETLGNADGLKAPLVRSRSGNYELIFISAEREAPLLRRSCYRLQEG